MIAFSVFHQNSAQHSSHQSIISGPLLIRFVIFLSFLLLAWSLFCLLLPILFFLTVFFSFLCGCVCACWGDGV